MDSLIKSLKATRDNLHSRKREIERQLKEIREKRILSVKENAWQFKIEGFFDKFFPFKGYWMSTQWCKLLHYFTERGKKWHI